MEPDQSEADTVPRWQVECALELLECFHGMWLRNERPFAAYAFNESIEVLQMALDDEFDDPEKSDLPDANVYRSRMAREQGWQAATLHGQRYENRSRSEPGVLESIWSMFE